MLTVFIINPKAGTGKKVLALKEKIQEAANKHRESIEVYETQGPRDGEWYVRQKCMESQGAPIRFIACGGDGTFSEVANGAIGYANAMVGAMPMGTGNDFCRNFPKDTPFSDVEAQLFGEPFPCDAISFTGIIEGGLSTRYSVNMINIGFDCNVAAKAAELKQYPLVEGKFAYLLSIFAILGQKKGANLRISIGEQTVQDGPLLLTSIANGSFCGGGIWSNPGASLQDGLMDINVVYDIPRRRFLTVLPHYAKGTHPEMKGVEKILTSYKCEEMIVVPKDGEMTVCVDGEIIKTEELHLKTIKNAFSFSVPTKKNLNILEETRNIKIG